MKASVKYKVIYRHSEKYSISEMCRIFGVSRSGYYDYVKRMDKPAKDLSLAEKIKECQEECKHTYGYRRVHIWLDRNGVHCNPKTVLRVMNKYNLLSVVRRKRYVKYGNAGQCISGIRVDCDLIGAWRSRFRLLRLNDAWDLFRYIYISHALVRSLKNALCCTEGNDSGLALWPRDMAAKSTFCRIHSFRCSAQQKQ